MWVGRAYDSYHMKNPREDLVVLGYDVLECVDASLFNFSAVYVE